MHILFLSRSLHRGGAERQLVTLANGLSQRGHTVSIALFYAGGPLEADLQPAITLHHLGKTGRWDLISFGWRLLQLVRRLRPDVLHSYMAIPNNMAILLKVFAGRVRVVWSIRSAFMDVQKYGKVAQASYWLERKLSRFADAIIFNSHAGKLNALHNGFSARHTHVIPNGIDVDRFLPSPTTRQETRTAWGVDKSHLLIGVVARLDLMKDHPTFLSAAALLVQAFPQARFACVGGGPVAYQQQLQQMAADLGIAQYVSWIEAQSDMPAVYSALDILCSASYGEGFSNVIAEAMACGVPCVVTDVGDSAWIVGDTGEVVPAQDAHALAAGLQRALNALQTDPGRGQKARQRIQEIASIGSLLDATEAVLWPSA
ncbi:MAG: glycosyltransferase [Caldilineaceae bacterium]